MTTQETSWYTENYKTWLENGAPLNTNVEFLAMGYSNIPELTDKISNLPNLETLIVGSNIITSIPSSLSTLTKLTQLDIGKSQISTLPEELRNFKQNIKIIVDNTPLFKNPPAKFKRWPSNITFKPPLFDKAHSDALYNQQMTQLNRKYIFKFDSYLEWISIGCPPMPNVTELELKSDDLNAQPITEITNQITNLKNLERIHFVDIDITELPSSIITLNKFESIKIHNTYLERLPAIGYLGGLTQLKYLELKQCQIESFPPTIVKLKNLVSLDFENTPLQELPPNIGQLKNLRNLNLAGTVIESLPESIGQLTYLRILNLSDTGIESLPESIGQLTYLEILILKGTGITELPETLKNITGHTIGIAIAGTPILSNPEYVLELRSWPSNFKIKPLPNPPPPPPPLAPEPLSTVRMQVNPYLKAQDIININNNDTAQQFLNLNEGYKIFICNGLYYATSYNLLSSYINNPINEYYICNRLTNGRFQRTNINPLISINIITGFQGFLKKAQLLMALNSQNNYFELSEQGTNIAVIKGRINLNVVSDCQEANAKLYNIKNIDVIDRTELISNINNKTDYSDTFKDVDSENEDNKFNTFKDVDSENEDNARGGKTRRIRKCVKNSTSRFRKSRKCVKNSTSRFRKSRRR
jgi:Leucine-rich repeat (LRR) protein